MREVVITHHGGPEALEERMRPIPEPGPGEVRIRVRAAGVNFSDIMARLGLEADAPKPPFVPGLEVAGYIDAIGPGPSRHELKRQVLALTHFGGYADTVVVPSDYVWNAPPNLSHNEAAAIPVSYLTAVLAMYRIANLKSGETIVIQSAGGGVGMAAIQLARLRRAVIIGTASSGKLPALRGHGADHALDGHAPDLDKEVARITGGRGADVVLDPLGGESFERSYRMLAPMGRLVVFGTQSMVTGQHRNLLQTIGTTWTHPKFNAADLMADNRGVFGLSLMHLWKDRRALAAAMDALLVDFASGRLKPVIAKTFPLARAGDAQNCLQDRINVGKVVLTT